MTHDEAQKLLGVDGSETDRELRRAYLRAVKRHPPERDGEQFARVREAYELLRDGACHAPAPPVRVPIPVPAPVAEPEPEPEPDLEAELEGLEPGSDAAVEKSRELVERFPRSAAAHWSLEEQLDLGDREPEAVDALHDAHRAGLDGFLESLLWRAPERVSDAELLAAEASLGGAVRTRIAAAWCARGRPVRASRLLRRQLEAARLEDETPPYAATVVEVVFELLSRGRFKSARRLEASFRAWLAHSGPGWLDSRSGGLWALACELLRVEPELDPELVTAMARDLAWAGEDAAPSMDEVVIYRASRRRRAKQAVPVLARHAPNLHRLFAELLAPPRAASTGSGKASWGWIVLVVLGINAARVCTKVETPESRVASPPPPTDPLVIEHLARTASLAADPEAARLAVELRRQIERKDCPAARRTFRSLSAADAGVLGAGSAVMLDAVRAEIDYICPSAPEPGDD